VHEEAVEGANADCDSPAAMTRFTRKPPSRAPDRMARATWV